MVGSQNHYNLTTLATIASCNSDQSLNSPGLHPHITNSQNPRSVDGGSTYSDLSKDCSHPIQGNVQSSIIMDPQYMSNMRPHSGASSCVYYPFGYSSLQPSGKSNSPFPKGLSSSHSAVTWVEPIDDYGMHRSKLLKTETGYKPMLMVNNLIKFPSNSYGNLPFPEANPNLNERLCEHLKGRSGMGIGQETHMQCGPQLHGCLTASNVAQNDFLQQQVEQTRLMRLNPTLAAQLQQHGILPQHVQPHIIRQQLLQQHQQQVLKLQHSQQQLQKLPFHVSQLNKQAELSHAGVCVQILMQFLHHQRMRPKNNDIRFWKELVSRYFSPNARRIWCLSQCCSQSNGQHANGVLPQAFWNCNICGSPGHGFEATAEILPRVCKTRFDSGELEDLLFLGHPNKYQLESGLLVLEYGKAIQEVVYEHARVVWEGHLQIAFSSALKIVSWDFCAKSHEEIVLRRFIAPQVTQLAAASCRYQSSLSQNNGTGLSCEEIQSSGHMLASSAHQLARSLQSPYVNELGFTKPFVRFMQIAEVATCMKSLMDFSFENNLGPIESLSKYFSHTSEVSKQANQAGSCNSNPAVLNQSLPSVEVLESVTRSQNSIEGSNVDNLDVEADDQDSNLSGAVSKHTLQSRQACDSPQSSVFVDESVFEPPNLAVDGPFGSLKNSANETSHIDTSLLVVTPTDSFHNINSPESVNIDFSHHGEVYEQPQCYMSLNTESHGVGFEDSLTFDQFYQCLKDQATRG